MRCEGMDWMNLAPDSEKQQALLNAVNELLCFTQGCEFLEWLSN
jgi:hypothetical protein